MTTRRVLRPAPHRHVLVRSLAAAALGAGLGTVSAVLLPAEVAGATTYTVVNCNDSGPGSLRAAVAGASSGDIIDFSVGCATITLDSELDLSEDISIIGPGASSLALSGNGSSTAGTLVVVEPGVTATISDLTIEDGGTYPPTSNGGGIDNEGTLALDDSVVTGNFGLNGGGIDNSGTLALSSSSVSDNYAVGIAADQGFGGGIYSLSPPGSPASSATVDDSVVSGNVSYGSGGGIESDGPLTVTDSTVSENFSYDGTGGGIDVGQYTTSVEDSTISGNTELGLAGGGGAYLFIGYLTLSNSTVADNSAPNGSGGGIRNDFGDVTIDNSTVAGNSAQLDGGDLYGRPPSSASNLQATIVADGGSAGDCAGDITDDGYNLDDDGTCGLTATGSLSDSPAGLAPAGLANNGGPTQTIKLQGLSPAIDHVAAAACPATDQRGVARAMPCSIGAYEGTLSNRGLEIYLIDPFFYIWPDPPPNEGYTDEGTLGNLLPDPGTGLIALYGCQDGTEGNFLSVDQSGDCEASAHPGLAITSLGIAGWVYTVPPPNGLQTAPLYRCVSDDDPPQYLETTMAPVNVDGQQRCGEDGATFAFDRLLGYVLASSPPPVTPEVPFAPALPVLAIVLMGGVLGLRRRRVARLARRADAGGGTGSLSEPLQDPLPPVVSAAARLAKALARCESRPFSAGGISPKLRPSPSSGTNTGS